MCDEEEKPVLPKPGSAKLIIEDEQEALFLSATWTVRARVDGVVMWESKPRDESHGDAFVAQWSRYVIRKNAKTLRELGVDIVKDYINVGGRKDELPS
jgi:hypothetical protein